MGRRSKGVGVGRKGDLSVEAWAAMSVSGIVCLGTPNSSSLRALGCSSCGLSAIGMASTRGTWKGSGGTHPRNVVESDRWKNGCLRPVPFPAPPTSDSPSMLSVSMATLWLTGSSSASSWIVSSLSTHDCTEPVSRMMSESTSVPLRM